MKTTFLIINLIIGIYSSIYSCEIHAIERSEKESIKIFNNGFTYLFVNFQEMTLKIFEHDENPHHPIFSRDIFRGNFKLEHIKDDFYSLKSDFPGKKCVNTMVVSERPSETNDIVVNFLLGESKNRYIIEAKNIYSDSIYAIDYPAIKHINLPNDGTAYSFSILPSEEFLIPMSGIAYGFQYTLKYLDLPFLYPNTLNSTCNNSTCNIEISLPLFNDDIFDLWCINGDIMKISNQILNEKIIWHGKEYIPYKSIIPKIKF